MRAVAIDIVGVVAGGLGIRLRQSLRVRRRIDKDARTGTALHVIECNVVEACHVTKIPFPNRPSTNGALRLRAPAITNSFARRREPSRC